MMKKSFLTASALLVLFGVCCLVLPHVKKMYSKDSAEVAGAALLRQMEELNGKYNADCEKLLSAFSGELEGKISPDFDRASGSVPQVVGELCRFKICMNLCYKGAKDKLQGTHDFADAYMSVLDRPVVQPCIHANTVAADMLQNLQLRLKERHAQYAMELAAVYKNSLSETKPSKNPEEVQNMLNEFSGSVQDAALKTAFAGAGVVFEVIFIRETWRYAVKFFAKPVVRICASFGIGGICAVADGPLPIGDIAGASLAVGGLAWTAWDVYDVSRIMPEKLKSELYNGIISAKTKLLEESRERAGTLVSLYRQEGKRLDSELKNYLAGEVME